MRVFFFRSVKILLMLSAVLNASHANAEMLEPPLYQTTVAEDISTTTWARCRFQIDKSPQNVSLAFYAYNYYENDSPLFIRVNGNNIRYMSDEDRGIFSWHIVKLPAQSLVRGINEIVFFTESASTNTWALGIEYAEDPQGSSKSTNQGKSWYSENLGYNYSVTGNYAIRILDSNRILPLKPIRDDHQAETSQKAFVATHAGLGQSTGGKYEKYSGVVNFSVQSLLESMRDSSIEMDSAGARLRRGEIIKNENGNAQLNIDRSKLVSTDPLATPWWVGERVTDTTWIKKELSLETEETDAAYLMFFYSINSRLPRKGSYLFSEGGSTVPLIVKVNGRLLDPIIPDTGWRNRTEDWRLIEIPKSNLRSGLNELVFHTEKDGDWRFAYENTTLTNYSARSTDSGGTWNYNRIGENGKDNGEYLIRLYLDRFHGQGMVWSLPFSLGVEDGNSFLRNLKDISVSLFAEGDIPEGTAIQLQARFGTGIIPDVSWSKWSPPSTGGTLTIQPPDDSYRFMQWRAILTTDSRIISPLLTSVRVNVSGSREIFMDENSMSITAMNNPPLRLSSLSHDYDSSDNIILKTLRENYPLDEIMSQEDTEYDRLIRLASWIHESRYFGRENGRQHYEKYGIEARTTHWAPNNGLWALNMFSRGYGHLDKRYGSHCHDYNFAYIDCLLSLGFVARPLIMTRMRPPAGGHSFPEVWSNQFNKWIYIDPYRGQVYVRDDGVPVNTMEIHQAQFDENLFNSISTIKIERLFASPEVREKDTRPERDECPRGYESFGIWLRSNLNDEPAPYPIWDGVMSFRWDGRLWFQNPEVQFLPEFSSYTQREDDMYWSVNQCFLQPYYFGNGNVGVIVSHTMPNMKHIEYRFVEKEAWRTTQRVLNWRLVEGMNHLYVRAVNDFGIAGPVSTITIRRQ